MNSITSPHRRLSFDSVKRQAHGQWRYILAAAGVPEKHLARRHGPCPACGGTDRFRFDDKHGTGSFCCNQCGAGDGFKLIELCRGCSPAESLRLVADILNIGTTLEPVAVPPATRPDEAPAERPWARRLLERTWADSLAVSQGDPVWLYLTQTRRLALQAVPDVMRYHPDLEYRDSDNQPIGSFPAMVAQVAAPDGSMCNIHRTYLTIDGNKAPVPKPKKLMPPIKPEGTRGAAIRLHAPGEVLAVAEGIETAVAVHLSTGFPAWATICTDGMASLVVPATVGQVAVYADNDSHGKGQASARKLAERLYKQGIKSKIVVAPVVGADWCDIYKEETK